METTMSNDLSQITSGKNVVEIRHPATAEPIGLSITMRHSESPEVKAVARKQLNENLRLRGKMPSAEKVEANKLDLLTAATESWTWGKDANGEDANWGGEQLECTPANVRRILREAPWIKAQLDDGFGDEAAFFQG
jgi:hypothetical protein